MSMRTLFAAAALALAPLAAPAVEMGDDGLHKADWMMDTFKDLAEDHAEAAAEGRTLMLLIEQRGCIYCRKMHEEVFSDPEIAAILSEDFFVVQINMFGDVEVTDFDGTALTEKEAATRWGMLFTPTMLLFPPEVEGASTAVEAAVAVMPGAFSRGTTLDLLTWVRDGHYLEEEGFQKYHARMIEERG